jgi:UDP-N-acetylmuramoylalanine--D-glutamate ligase
MKKRIVILGSGESGTGAALLALRQGFDVFVSDKGAIKDEYKKQLDAYGIAWEEEQHSIDKILKANEIIKSPGIPERSEVMQAVRAKGIRVIGEIEFGWRYAGKCKIVAITGSNGKTTTTELIYHLLKTAGLNVRKGGNVGNSFATMVNEDLEHGDTEAQRIFVLEVSSFQLDDIQKFRPDIAILLNITPDHLDRYDYKLENYARSKFRITMNQKRGDTFIFNAFDPVMKEFMTETKAKKVGIRRGFFKEGLILAPADKSVGRDEKSPQDFGTATRRSTGGNKGKHAFDMTRGNLRGPHNMFNAACAIRAALLLGAGPGKIQEGLDTFTPPPHRLEKVAVVNGVTYINDSKATNVDSVFYALQAMDTPTVWIVGGQDKGNDYSPLFKLVRKKVKAIVCMGVDNSKIVAVFKKFKKPVAQTRSAEEAVKAATDFAEKGDTALLSPACASFDLFKNYEDRGEQFKQAVLKLKN